MKNPVGRVGTAISVLAIGVLGYLMTVAEAGIEPASSLPEPAPLERDANRPPNIIFITIDTLRADRVGGDLTPTLNGIAEEGTVFENATVPFPRTTPSMASLFTGLWPSHHGSREVWSPIKKGVMLASLLKEQGWATAGVTSNSACDKKQGFEEGFDAFVSKNELKPDDAANVTSKALELAFAADDDKPLFLWVHYIDPHWKYAPPKSFEDQPRAGKCRGLINRENKRKISGGQIRANHNGMSARAKKHCAALYDAEVAYTDSEIERLIHWLRRANRWEDAIIVFTSDHGENMGEDGYWFGHGPSTHEVAVKVPLTVRVPGMTDGSVDDGIIRIEDIMPTVLEIAGVPRDAWPEMDGKSMAWRIDPQVEPPAEPVTAALIEAGTPLRARAHTYLVSGRRKTRYCYNGLRYSLCIAGEQEAYYDREEDPKLEKPLEEVPETAKKRLQKAKSIWSLETARQRSVREEKYKLVERPKLLGGFERALYDLEKDPDQENDLSEDFPEEVERLGAIIERWAADLEPFDAEEAITDEALEQLRSLGYIQ